ncbi:MAG: FHIPEP family type III secretion protein [Candidatus Gastranaerophilaceae bacterium]|jgi:flagellar biosynthesis protein FlhA
MFKNTKNEYSVQITPLDEPETLEALLNKMAKAGWDLVTLNEAESSSGKPCYNCLFTREAEEKEEEIQLVEIGDFKSKIEKMFEPSDEPYQQCRQLQRKIREKQERISRIKSSLESTTSENEHQKLNEEISNSLKELKDLKSQLAESLEPDNFYDKISLNKLSIVLSDELTDLVNPEFEALLVTETVKTRQNLVGTLGYVIPSVHFTNSENLEINEFVIQVRDIETLKGYVYPNHRMFYPSKAGLSRKPKDAIESEDFITGEKVYWLEESKTKNFWEKGLKPEEIIAKALEYIVLKYVDEILDYNDVNKYIEIVSKTNVGLIENIIPDFLSIGNIRFIFAQLLKEKIPLKDIVYIFEKLNDHADEENREAILINLRMSLARQICNSIADANKTIFALELSDTLVEKLEDMFINEDDVISVDVNFIQKLIKQIKKILQETSANIENTTLVVPCEIRHILFSVIEDYVPGLSVIAKEEISKDFAVELIGSVNF